MNGMGNDLFILGLGKSIILNHAKLIAQIHKGRAFFNFIGLVVYKYLHEGAFSGDE